MLSNILLLNKNTIGYNSSYIEIIFQLVFLIIVFSIVIFLAYYSTKFIANAKIKTMKNSNMKIIETISVGFNNLHILQINEKYYLISSSKDGIKYLAELDKEDLNISEENITSLPFEKNFKSYLDKFKTKEKAGDKDEK